MASAKGGKREGAGRPKGLRNKRTEKVKEIIDRVVDFDVVFKKMYELATGPKPDAYAAKLLLEYGFGKPNQSIDITSGDKEIQPVITMMVNGDIVDGKLKS